VLDITLDLFVYRGVDRATDIKEELGELQALEGVETGPQ